MSIQLSPTYTAINTGYFTYQIPSVPHHRRINIYYICLVVISSSTVWTCVIRVHSVVKVQWDTGSTVPAHVPGLGKSVPSSLKNKTQWNAHTEIQG